MKYLVGAMMITVLSCSAAYAEKKPYYTLGKGKNVLIEKCVEAFEKGHTIRSNNGDNSGIIQGESFGGNKFWSNRYALLGDRVYRTWLRTGSGYNFDGSGIRVECVEYKTTLVE